MTRLVYVKKIKQDFYHKGCFWVELYHKATSSRITGIVSKRYYNFIGILLQAKREQEEILANIHTTKKKVFINPIRKP